MPRESLFPVGAPPPAGPYSPAVVASGRLLFVSSQGPIDPASGALVTDSFEAEARQTLSNVRAIVEGAGGTLARGVKVTVFLRDFANFAAFNEIYAEVFPEPRAARTTVQSDLPFGVAVDIVVALDE